MSSLWLYPLRTTVVVPLERFADYPHYLEALEEACYPKPLPRTVTVRWRAYGAFTRYAISADNEEQRDEIVAFINSVKRRMKRGEDIPPLVVRGPEIVDGQHRAFAARALEIARAPTVDLSLELRER